MKAGIIAAGWGRRLGGGPKALTRVGGRTLIDLVIEGLVDAGADAVTCIVNEESTAVCAHVARAWPSLQLDWIVRTTPTSMHSFLLVLERLAARGDEASLVTTVDSVCRPGTTRDFVRSAARLDAALALGVTDVIDDEKPLYAVPRVPGGNALANEGGGGSAPVARNAAGVPLDGGPGGAFELAALSSVAGASRYVTAGFYWASPAILAERDQALSSGFTALRQFLGLVVSAGHRCYGVPLPPVIDVDRPQDVAAAERLVS